MEIPDIKNPDVRFSQLLREPVDNNKACNCLVLSSKFLVIEIGKTGVHETVTENFTVTDYLIVTAEKEMSTPKQEQRMERSEVLNHGRHGKK